MKRKNTSIRAECTRGEDEIYLFTLNRVSGWTASPKLPIRILPKKKMLYHSPVLPGSVLVGKIKPGHFVPHPTRATQRLLCSRLCLCRYRCWSWSRQAAIKVGSFSFLALLGFVGLQSRKKKEKGSDGKVCIDLCANAHPFNPVHKLFSWMAKNRTGSVVG